MTNNEAQLELLDLSVDVFDESIAARRRLVSDVSFVLKAGQGLGITGESGSGKTTLSLALSGLLPVGSHISARRFRLRSMHNSVDAADYWDSPSASRLEATGGAGSARLDRRTRAVRGRSIFTLFQEPRSSLNPYRTIGWQLNRCTARGNQNARRGTRSTDSASPAAAALKSVGLETDVMRHYPHELSTGMCQRVFLAMASLLGSSILIADEPFASVDAETQSRLAALVRDWVRNKGLTLLLISHELDLLRELTDYALIMYRGQVAEFGPSAEVLAGERPGHPYTRLLREVSGRPKHRADSVVRLSHSAVPVACCFASRCAWADASVCVEAVPASRLGEPSGSPPVSSESARRIRCVRHPISGVLPNSQVDDAAPPVSAHETGEDVLRVQGISKEFATGWFWRRTRKVLSDVSFTLGRGERLGIMGPSGQGKTTLARVILGLVPPNEGQVQVALKNRWINVERLRSQDRSQFRRHVQMVYQDADLVLDPAARIGDVLVEAYQVFQPHLDVATAYGLASRLLQEMALPETLLEAYPYRLSGGERKRVALARSLAAFGCPSLATGQDAWRLLILDEPTAGVDVFLQAILCRFLLWVQPRLRLSYLVISHDENFVQKFCHRALRLEGGHISWDKDHVNLSNQSGRNDATTLNSEFC